MSYRLEISANGRATCSTTHCKNAGTKILKGEIRQGVLVPFNEHTSWKWRHWGCVTPEVICNWKVSSGGDMDLVDGYDTLPPDVQGKVQRAFEQGHVDDDDWNGDQEMNRYTGKRQGMFVKTKTPKKKAKKDDDDEDENEPDNTPVKEKGKTKKRGRSRDDDDEADGDDDVKPKTKKPRAKKAVKAEAKDDESEVAPPVKKTRKSAKAKDDGAHEGDVAPKPAAKKDAQESAPAVKATSKTSAVDDELGDKSEEEKPKPQKRKAKGRGKKAAAVDEE
ncbi:hypothetical protein B0A55_06706 [Friedmanniomyces simplex]|uniref:PARP-type domain-containing protein n=1 Tax=Friedmanniomyces simplex TaxID=329884 RepID=A0A4U0X5W9_9PEZI|nr:hypothetical protein B0A55_06706 [Friedmanniomyces simplex]